jgi:hypothetical protein
MPYDPDSGADTHLAVEYVGHGYKHHRTRARLLAEITDLPDNAYVTSKHAAAFLDTTPAQLANWRMQRRGPPFVGGDARFVRYKISDLKDYMQQLMKPTRR